MGKASSKLKPDFRKKCTHKCSRKCYCYYRCPDDIVWTHPGYINHEKYCIYHGWRVPREHMRKCPECYIDTRIDKLYKVIINDTEVAFDRTPYIGKDLSYNGINFHLLRLSEQTLNENNDYIVYNCRKCGERTAIWIPDSFWDFTDPWVCFLICHDCLLQEQAEIASYISPSITTFQGQPIVMNDLVDNFGYEWCEIYSGEIN